MLREREADPEWFDGTVLTARKALKRLYALLHIAPGARAQKVLFDRDPPAESRLFALQELARASQPGRAGPAHRRAPHSVPGGGHRGDAADAIRLAGPDRPHEPAGIDQQPGAR